MLSQWSHYFITLVQHYKAAKEFRCVNLVEVSLFIRALILPLPHILHVIPIPALLTAALCLFL